MAWFCYVERSGWMVIEYAVAALVASDECLGAVADSGWFNE